MPDRRNTAPASTVPTHARVQRRVWLGLSIGATLAACGGSDSASETASKEEAAAFSARVALMNAALAAQSPPSIEPPAASQAPPPPSAPVGPPRPPVVGPPGTPPAAVQPANRRATSIAYVRTVVARDLQHPTDAAVMTDGTLFIVERDRGLSVQRKDGRRSQVFSPPDLVLGAGQGMQSVALDREFARNRFAYVLMVTGSKAQRDARVVRLTLSPDLAATTERVDLLTGIERSDTPPAGGPAARPVGLGRLRVGPDGLIYVATADGGRGRAPQSGTDLAGKVLRIDRSGAPAGKPVQPGFDARVFTYGLRDPRGLAFHPSTQQAFVAEAGSLRGGDEVTPIAPGGNGGWDPRCKQGDGYCGDRDGSAPMTDLARHPNALRPVWSAGQPHGLSGAGFARGAAWRDLDGALIVTFAGDRPAEALQMTPAGQVIATTAVFGDAGVRLGGVVEGPGGDLHLLTARDGKDEIWRLSPSASRTR
jgi:glucose/arabinose dehydrogenase